MKTRIMLAGMVIAPLALFAGTALADTINQQLDFGMTNSDVTTLQTFLAQDSTLYPQGLVTGFFGPLTRAAVINFQARNGIDTVGRVGPITLAALNAQMNGVSVDEGAGKINNTNTPQPMLSATSVTSTTNSATITWTSSTPASAKVFYSAQPSFVYKTASNAVGAAGLSNNQSVTITGLQGTTTYYYTVESLDSQGNFSWSPVGNSFRTQ